MNIKQTPRSRKGFWWSAAYWLIIVLIALLYLRTPSGTGNGQGTGSGAADHGTGTGAATQGTGDGAGSGETGDPHAPGSGPGGGSEPASGANPQAEKTPVPAPAPKGASDGKITANSGLDAPAPPAPDAEPTRELATGREQKPQVSKQTGGRKSGFFGVEAASSKRVLFLVDVSSSMDARTGEGISRLELLKRELKKVIAEMQRKAKNPPRNERGFSDYSTYSFRIVAFASQTTFMPAANKKAFNLKYDSDVAKAMQQVDNLTAGGGTAMKRAWEDLKPVLKSDRTEAVFFLSDGEPNDCCPAVLITFLKNDFPKLIINTFSMGCQSQLLQNIAADHRGKAVEVY